MNRISLKRAAGRSLLVLARFYVDLTIRTTRWTITGAPESFPSLLQTSERPADGCITAAWHRTLLMLPAMCRWAHHQKPDLPITVMISRNRDGRFISDLIAPWNIASIEGSSDRNGKNKGGSRALREACIALKNGAIFMITPDGPRGPAETVQAGTETLMRLTGKPLVPIGAACTGFTLPSWDRLRVPLPFGRGYLLYGAPCTYPMTGDEIAAKLKTLSARAESSLALGRATLADRLWMALGTVLLPALRAMSLIRLRRGKERLDRLPERRGRTGLARPQGTILWLHAASVGETHSILPLIAALAERHPTHHFLVTTATTSGADIIAAYQRQAGPLASRLIHQFIPYDVPLWTRRFLDHWRPSALLLTDSELWPGIILACTRRAIPVGVLNGRLSVRSWQRWEKMKRFAPPLFKRLAFVAARGAEDARHFAALGVRDVVCFGDLKQNAPPPSVDHEELAALRAHIGKRPVFLAASTHDGEDEIVLRAAALVRRTLPDLLTIIAPRHPVRGEQIAALVTPSPPRRSLGQKPSDADPIWIADTLGELGLFYRLAHCALIGNSLLPSGGGHNPFEPVRLDVVLATGPYHGNFRPAFEKLGGFVTAIKGEEDLAEWIGAVVDNPTTWQAKTRQAQAAIASQETVPAALLDRIDALCV
ncbi:glycosyltransferase N-terminal domain-containing protein [Asaia spathodeae]|uniref:3-deoxy-D-manno-octulosonic acid transferase n=1 Tax=Asaia spathodeae TaxID=657016 RepID=A0ABX2P1J2_9PROT|nr:glycosyltransferase N-terminal domain-containing protein [Asaia spathodeae]GBR13209.1 3-deoxy-D-manno-octulosonic-acid transferase [Asaia spathodeae NBRC 105894]